MSPESISLLTRAINWSTEQKLLCNTMVVVVKKETAHASAHLILWPNELIPYPDVCMYYVVPTVYEDLYDVRQACKGVGTKPII